MKHIPQDEVVWDEVIDMRNHSSHVAPNDFKTEVASIVNDLSNRLGKLLEQHEACLLKASCNGSHYERQKEAVQRSAGSFRLESDIVFSKASMASEMESLPGCPEAAPRPPSAKPLESSRPPSAQKAWDSRGQLLQTRSTTSLRTTETCHNLPARAIWTEDHTDAQQEAISKYEREFHLVMIDKLPRNTRMKSLGRRGRKAQHSVGKRVSSKSEARLEPTFAVLHPVGQTRTAWNLVSLILICQDALTVPLLAFDIGDSGPWEVLAWFCTLFWTADVAVSFRTGYFFGVKVEMRPSKIARQYAMTWLSFDVFIVVFEWFSRLYASLAPPGVVRTTRVVRGVRLLKLLRITKMKRLLNEFAERLNSNTLALILNVFLLTSLLCAIAHFVACGWYALGTGTSDGWTYYDIYAVEQGLDKFGFPFWYLSSARWVVSQINGRTDMDERRNLPERGFTVVAGIVLSVVGRSVFVALITKSMLQLSDLYKTKEARRRSVNDYLSLNPVPATIERSVKAHAEEYKDMDVERQREGIVLALLPKHLQKELVYEVRKPLLEKHAFFGFIMQGFEIAAHQLCFDVVKQLHAASQEMIFKSKDPCSRMLLMDTGSMTYGLSTYSVWAPDRDTDSEEEKVLGREESIRDTFLQCAVAVTRVTRGMWLSEPALWAKWSNKGTLLTEDNCCMLEVDVMMLGAALQEHTDLFGLTVVYAKHFLNFLRKEPVLSDILSFDVQNVEPDLGD